ncbi:LPD29 domain-containing protein [Burkholderia cepacia]|uniref:LPD29 domain-containing protein n=1 Tax=Burkholderia cepacia TaxID=292 RepID=UPI003EDEFC14
MATTQQTRTNNANRAFPAPQAPQTARVHSKTPTAPTTATSPAALVTVLTLVETAQLVQTILVESFGSTGARFYVKAQHSEGGTRIFVEWMDGPTEPQVNKLLLPLQSSIPGTFGGTTSVEHFRLTPAGPQKLVLAADRIVVKRGFSAGLIGRVLQRLAHRHAARLNPEVHKLLTVESFKKGALLGVLIYGVHWADAGNSLHTDVENALHAHTDVQGYPRSATAASIFARKPLKA